jgi:hypothetical protein
MIVGVDDFIIRRRFGIVNLAAPRAPKKAGAPPAFQEAPPLT